MGFHHMPRRRKDEHSETPRCSGGDPQRAGTRESPEAALHAPPFAVEEFYLDAPALCAPVAAGSEGERRPATDDGLEAVLEMELAGRCDSEQFRYNGVKLSEATRSEEGR